MRAAVAVEGRIVLHDLPDLAPGPGQVLVAPIAVGICASDLHLLARQAATPDEIGPIVLGHEFSARLLGYGPNTPPRLPVGTTVCSVPFVGTAGAPELIGMSTRYPGACAEQMLLDADRLLPVPPHVDPQHAALTEPLAVGIHAVAEAAVQPDDTCLVLGAGPVGLAVIAALTTTRCGPVVAADFSALRRRLAEKAGAHEVIDPAEHSPYQRWAQLGGPAELASPLLDRSGPAGRTVVFDCAGQPGILSGIITAAPPHTRIIVVGVNDRPDAFTPVDAITKELTLRFVFAYRPHEFVTALQAIATGQINVAPWITTVLPLDEASTAFTAATSPHSHGKALIRHSLTPGAAGGRCIGVAQPHP